MNINCTALFAVVLGLASVALTMVGTVGCSTFEINLMQKRYTNSSTGQNVTGEYNIQFSPYLYHTTISSNDNEYGTECQALPSILEYDRKWKSAAILPIVSWFIAVLNILALSCLICCANGRSTFPVIGCMFAFINTIFNGLIFLIFRSTTCDTITIFLSAVVGSNVSGDNLTCEVGPAFPYTVAGICGYFITGLICLCDSSYTSVLPKLVSGFRERDVSSPSLDNQPPKLDVEEQQKDNNHHSHRHHPSDTSTNTYDHHHPIHHHNTDFTPTDHRHS